MKNQILKSNELEINISTYPFPIKCLRIKTLSKTDSIQIHRDLYLFKIKKPNQMTYLKKNLNNV